MGLHSFFEFSVKTAESRRGTWEISPLTSCVELSAWLYEDSSTLCGLRTVAHYVHVASDAEDAEPLARGSFVYYNRFVLCDMV